MYSTQPLLNLLSPNSDQHQFCPNIINALSREEGVISSQLSLVASYRSKINWIF